MFLVVPHAVERENDRILQGTRGLCARLTAVQVVLVDVATQVKIGSEEMSLQALYNVTMIPMMQVLPYGVSSRAAREQLQD